MLDMDQARHSDGTPGIIFQNIAADRKACKNFQKS